MSGDRVGGDGDDECDHDAKELKKKPITVNEFIYAEFIFFSSLLFYFMHDY